MANRRHLHLGTLLTNDVRLRLTVPRNVLSDLYVALNAVAGAGDVLLVRVLVVLEHLPHLSEN